MRALRRDLVRAAGEGARGQRGLFRSAFSGAPIGIALSDFDGRLLRVNPALAELLGHSVEELLQMTVSDIPTPTTTTPTT